MWDDKILLGASGLTYLIGVPDWFEVIGIARANSLLGANQTPSLLSGTIEGLASLKCGSDYVLDYDATIVKDTYSPVKLYNAISTTKAISKTTEYLNNCSIETLL
jgi:hypothetical protein